jgi:hypothetical protein
MNPQAQFNIPIDSLYNMGKVISLCPLNQVHLKTTLPNINNCTTKIQQASFGSISKPLYTSQFQDIVFMTY